MRWRKHNPRLPGHDYAGAGVYFITCCTAARAPLLTEEIDGRLVSSTAGRIVESCWNELPGHYPHLRLDAFITMPDHLHGILVFKHPAPNRRHGLSEIVRALKSFSARRLNESQGTQGRTLWQRGYHHVVIQNRRSLDNIRRYVRINRKGWEIGAGLRPAPERMDQCIGEGLYGRV